jgi:hypothetical protein
MGVKGIQQAEVVKLNAGLKTRQGGIINKKDASIALSCPQNRTARRVWSPAMIWKIDHAVKTGRGAASSGGAMISTDFDDTAPLEARCNFSLVGIINRA